MKGKEKAIEERMQQLWQDIEKWYQANTPALLESLKPPAGDSEIAECEAALGRALPDDYKASLKVHDGEVAVHDYTYVGTARVVELWSRMKEANAEGFFDGLESDTDAGGRVQKAAWHEGYIPFAEDSGGNLICIDLDPGAKGKAGQIVKMELRAGPYYTEQDSFEQWLTDYRDGLAGGKYRVRSGFIVEK